VTKRFWAGLDVGVETSAVCVIDDAGEIIHEGSCPTAVQSVHRELVCLRRRRFARVGLEGGTGTTLARGLRNLGYEVDLYEARQLSKFLRLRRNKTDAGDAIGIAEAGRLGAATISRVHLKSLECQCLQSRLTIRRHLIHQRVAAVNILGRQLELFGGRLPRKNLGSLRHNVEGEIRKIFGRAPNDLTGALRHLLQHCEQLIAYQRTVDDELRRCAFQNEVCRRFMEIPGVGPLCALTFYAVVSDPNRFSRSADVGSYLGLTPRVDQSGLMLKRGRISKMGNTAARTLLVRSSGMFMRSADADTNLRVWAHAVEQRRGLKKARVALARKLSIMMLSMWKSGQSYVPRLSTASATQFMVSEPAGRISTAVLSHKDDTSCESGPSNLPAHNKNMRVSGSRRPQSC